MNSSMEKTDTGLSCEFKQNLSILREINFFSKLPMETLKVLAYLCSRETFKAGDYLFRQKDDDGHAFYVISGKAKLEHQNDQKSVVTREVGAGSFFGSLSLLSESPRLFTLQALTETVCLMMYRDKFIKTIEQFPDIMPRILKEVVDGIHVWEERFLSGSDTTCVNCIQKIGVSLL